MTQALSDSPNRVAIRGTWATSPVSNRKAVTTTDRLPAVEQRCFTSGAMPLLEDWSEPIANQPSALPFALLAPGGSMWDIQTQGSGPILSTLPQLPVLYSMESSRRTGEPQTTQGPLS